MPSNDTHGVDFGLQRMVYPLSDTNPEDAKRNKGSWYGWIGLKEPSARKKENNDANDHKDLVPVIKGELGKRIIQWLLRGKG